MQASDRFEAFCERCALNPPFVTASYALGLLPYGHQTMVVTACNHRTMLAMCPGHLLMQTVSKGVPGHMSLDEHTACCTEGT